ncbi:MAG: hypothetical protein A2047_02820 [Omnitrophica bacterium GWA2_41_15]|nr:MAG: hypothetical protein A2047_02820 [Omnitrophica bacterium GWA2_41_15]HAZ10109.1 hypothetical protein [Candidatus Omnitrophota bacterium]
MKINAFLKLWLNVIRNSIAMLKKQSLLKIYFILLCSLLFLAIEFLICYVAFSFMRGIPEVGSIIVERLMFLFYFALFLMLIFSNAIITYSTIYISKDTELLFSYPLSSGTVFRYKFIESNMLSSWAFMAILVPFMVSFGMANHADRALYIFMFLYFIPFLIIAGAIGSGLTMLLAKLLPQKKLRAVIFLISLFVALVIYKSIKRVRFEESGQTIEIFMLNQMLPNIHISHSPFLPSYWMAEGILKASLKEFKDAFYYFLLLLSTALFFTETLVNLAEKIYLISWQELHSQAREKIFCLGRGIIERIRPLFKIFGMDSRGLIIKDMKLFWREPMQWTQFVIFFGILGVYFVNIRHFSYNMLQPFWKHICAFLNLSAILLTLGSLSTRFIFPQISLEGNKFWIIGLSPLGLKKVLYGKFLASFTISFFITESLLMVSNKMLGISGLLEACFIWVILIMNLALIGLSMGLGAAFPDFKSENPAKIVSGFGGTLTLIASIGFILIAVAVTIFPFQLFLKGHISTYMDLKKAAMISMGIVSLIGIGLCIFPLLYGEKKLAAMEF